MILADAAKTSTVLYILFFTSVQLDLFCVCSGESGNNQEAANPNGWFDHINCMLSNRCGPEPPVDVEEWNHHSKKWDILIYTQTYANTLCFIWEEASPSNHSCNMPPDTNAWRVYGIWPTKLGTREPSYCNSSWHFNMTQLTSIAVPLARYWTNVEVPSHNTSLWQHEWEKHGTCAASLPSLNTEMKYFGQGLKWHGEYNMTSILEKGGIVPDSKNPTNHSAIYQALKKALQVNPAIDCIYDKKTARNYLYEIKICFDKTLKLIKCDGIKEEEKLYDYPLGRCSLSHPVYYIDSVPPVQREWL